MYPLSFLIILLIHCYVSIIIIAQITAEKAYFTSFITAYRAYPIKNLQQVRCSYIYVWQLKYDPPISPKLESHLFFTHASSLQAQPILKNFCSFFNSNDHERERKPQMISFLGTQQVTKGINGRPWESALASCVFLSFHIQQVHYSMPYVYVCICIITRLSVHCSQFMPLKSSVSYKYNEVHFSAQSGSYWCVTNQMFFKYYICRHFIYIYIY